MGKRQHQKDKMYLTCTEWSTVYGGHKGDSENKTVANRFRRLPFSHCALSLQPFEHPFCTEEGNVYDLMNILPYLKQFGHDPATGKKLDAKSLVKLNFYKNSDGKYHCPVLYKVFNANSHIVAVKVTGNVFSYEAIEQLNIKIKSFRDLLSDEPYDRKDLITLQDPSNLDKFNLSEFHHLKNNLKVLNKDEERAQKDPKYVLKCVSAETRDILNELDREYKAPNKSEECQAKADSVNAAHYSTGAVAASLTSTVMVPTTSLEPAILSEDKVRYARLKKKGYVQILTTHGNINLELHCDATPKAGENFILLCHRGYYKDTIFHRSIRNFMIQGGDPEGTGKGGESAWGKSFKDEFKPNLVHQGRGILSMANSGPDTNKSQFFITYRSCRHLDTKHTVFGRVVGGLETLNVMENVQTDEKDKPKEDIRILNTVVFVDPYQEVDEQLKVEREKAAAKAESEKNATTSLKKTNQDSGKPIAHSKGVGKYIAPTVRTNQQDVSTEVPKKKKNLGPCSFGNFSGW